VRSGLNVWSADSSARNSRLGPLQSTVRLVACEAGVPPDFALAVIEHESKFNNAMRGLHGEIGASQILPATAVALGFDPARLEREFSYNARAGVTILKMLLKRSAGNQKAASCCYRAGPGWTKLPWSKQSRILAYASTIERLQHNYAGLDCRP
jgi:soluble lytic murein transglycosylase-like protein